MFMFEGSMVCFMFEGPVVCFMCEGPVVCLYLRVCGVFYV